MRKEEIEGRAVKKKGEGMEGGSGEISNEGKRGEEEGRGNEGMQWKGVERRPRIGGGCLIEKRE